MVVTKENVAAHAIAEHLVGRGMGSPIPSQEEGAWTREGPNFVDGGLFVLQSVAVFALEP